MKKYILLIIISLALFSCSNPNTELKKIKDLEVSYYKNNELKPNIKKAKEIDTAYGKFINDFQDDTIVVEALFSRAKIQLGVLNNYPAGFKSLENIYHKFPNHRLAPMALQYHAFVLDEQLKDKIKAKAKYEELIHKYPHHPFAKDAVILIKMLSEGN